MATLDRLNSSTELGATQYAKGLETGRNAEHIVIAANGVWGARMKDGGSLYSYEKIGYHAGTEELLKGFVDSGVKIYDNR